MKNVSFLLFVILSGCDVPRTQYECKSFDELKLKLSMVDSIRVLAISTDTRQIKKFGIDWDEMLTLPDSTLVNIQYDSTNNIRGFNIRQNGKLIFSETYWSNGNPKHYSPNLFDDSDTKKLFTFYPSGETLMIGQMRNWMPIGKCTFYNKEGEDSAIVEYPRSQNQNN